MQSLVNLFNCFFFSFILRGTEKQKMLAALIVCATIKGREVFVFCSRWHACSVLNSAINGGGAAITALGAGIAQRGGRDWGSLVVHFDWSAEFCVERRGRDRLLKQIPLDQLELCNKNTLIFLGTFA